MKHPKIIDARVEIVTAALRRPFVTALGRKTVTTNAGVTLTLSGGARGYGEASGSLALAHLAAERLARELRRLCRRVLGREIACPAAVVREAWAGEEGPAPAAAAFEAALLSAWCAHRGLSLARWLGGALRAVETDITLSAVGAAETEIAAAEARREGFRVLKIKVGSALTEDLARVRAARRAHPRARILLDGNQGLTAREALALVEACLADGAPIELLEQPLPKGDLRGMKALAKRCLVPVAADESCATPYDAARLAGEGAAGAFNVKLAKSGILRSLEIAAVARAAGLPLMIGCMTETARGLSASAHVALGTGFFRWVDLDSDRLLVGQGAGEGWARRGARIEET